MKRLIFVTLLLAWGPPARGDESLAGRAEAAMEKASGFFESVSVGGGYAGIHSLDLKQRYGESLREKAQPTEIWIQPPGTPTVGLAYLRAWRATGGKRYFRLAREVALSLAWGQRAAGGWDHRADVSHRGAEASHPVRRKGRCTFDDRISQGALDFLMEFDQLADEPWLTESIQLAWKHLLEAQFPNGAWPQWYPLRGGYHDYYTFNDATINDCIAVLLKAHRLYGREELLRAALRGGDFIILSQISCGQAGWAQQYSHDLKPARARSFEPTAICSAVAARNIRTLVDLYLVSRDRKYLSPVAKAAAWLDKSKLAADTWARFYEVGTNRPIYGDRDGKVYYKLDQISEERRKGYSWQSNYGISSAMAYYDKALRADPDAFLAAENKPPSAESRKRRAQALAAQVRKVIAALDEKGRWVADGRIHCQDFVRNFNVLAEYVELAPKP